MPRVEVFSWNPRRSWLPRPLTQRLPVEVGRRVNNFGDLLGPFIVQRILAMHQIDPSAALENRRLLSVGSVLHFAQDHDVVWGSGVNGKKSERDYCFNALDVRAVRGPHTHSFLAARGIDAPEVFGDPVLLLPLVLPELLDRALVNSHAVTVVPNFNDFPSYAPMPGLLDPRSPVEVCLRRIAESELVVGSSLHAIVVAESLGVPARLMTSPIEDPFKYEDYYLGTGRAGAQTADTVQQAVKMGGERPPIFDAERLLGAFPFDLWRARDAIAG
jgi:pyruvyltransferase